MKKRLLSLILILILFLLTGCSKIDINNRLIVEGIAVDKSKDGVKITIQSFADDYHLYSAEGKTIYDALQNISARTGNPPFYANCHVIIFSYDVFPYGLSRLFDYILKNNDIRPDCSLCCVKGKAADVFGKEPSVSAQNISYMLESTMGRYAVFLGEMLDISTRFLESGCDTFLPVIENDNIKGVACFKDDKYACELFGYSFTGFMLINGFSVMSPISIIYKNTDVSFKIIDSKTDINCKIEDGFPVFSINLTCDLSLEEIFSGEFDFTYNDFDKLEKVLNKKLSDMLKSAQTAFFQNKSDIYKMGLTVRRQNPKYYKSLSDFKSVIPKCRATYTVDTSIVRAGQTDRP